MTEQSFASVDFAHNRYNPLTDQWVLVSPHRMLRPWSGQTEHAADEEVPEHDPTNPLCPGVTRGNGQTNPLYSSTFAFDNDFPALREVYSSSHALLQADSQTQAKLLEDPLFKFQLAKGQCRVICFHPKSNISLPLMTQPEIVTVINKWIEEYTLLGSRFRWVQIFENKGAIMGCSNPHPHCQIWSSDYLPNEARTKDRNQRAYYEKYGRPLLMDYVTRELEAGERILESNDHWVVLVPFWAFWPFETMILPKKRAIQRISQLTDEEKESLAGIMKRLLIRYDNLFEVSFPYSMGWHGAPSGDQLGEEAPHWILHASYYPPLLRSATIKKHMVGYELMAQAQRDLTAEKAAQRLREMPLVHYKERKAANK